jgi:hypothetical protein
MAILTVNRKGSWVAMARAYKIFLNGEVVGTVNNKKTTQIEVPAGSYKMKSGISFLSGMSPVIDVVISDDKENIVETGASKLFWLYYALSIVGGILVGIGANATEAIIFLIIGLAIVIVGCYLNFKNGVQITQIR